MMNLDPRYRIATYFRPGDSRGPLGYLKAHSLIPEGQCSDFFTVWRPTSLESVRKMVNGEGTGKALNIKGKSSKKGDLSGFVPFLQISKNYHKEEVSTDASSRVRIYYSSEELRDEAHDLLMVVMPEMIRKEELAVTRIKMALSGEIELDSPEERRLNMELKMKMEDPQIILLNSYCPGHYGLEMPERLMWEAYVQKQDINRSGNLETGRASSVPFMMMNLHSIRESQPPPCVLYQFDKETAMNPLTLVMAYEEEKLNPVVSDFDPFMIGTTGIQYDPLPTKQVEYMKHLIRIVKTILDGSQRSSWTEAWINATKTKEHGSMMQEIMSAVYGLGDPTTLKFIESCCENIGATGAVRHGAECFNFGFPQEIDDDGLLIVWTHFINKTGLRWQRVNKFELIEFLLERIEDGYIFPLNPKWVLCDEGWYKVWRSLIEKHSFEKLESWYPRDAMIIETIEAIHANHPDGFRGETIMDQDTQESMIALAEMEEKRKATLRRAKIKLKFLIRTGHFRSEFVE